MIAQKRNTALMVFSLSAKSEAERKPIFGSSRKNISSDFFQILINRTANLAKASGVDVIWMDESVQKGHNFAERYTNAFKDLFDKGYENVVSIGNDSPNLTVRTVKNAISQIQEKKMVLGPSSDGGIYLLGLNKTAFDASRFEKLPWLSSKLFDALIKNARSKNLSFYISALLHDIDNTQDALNFVKKNADSSIVKFILLHFTIVKGHTLRYSAPFYSFLDLASPSHRGPPVL